MRLKSLITYQVVLCGLKRRIFVLIWIMTGNKTVKWGRFEMSQHYKMKKIFELKLLIA